jgi:NDP-sugar pyrophosphorylase family protein
MLLQMREAGVDHVVLTVGHLSELLHAFFKDGSQFGIDISYSYEQCPLGTAGPIALVDGLADTFLVSNGDVLTTLNLRELIQFHRQQKAIATIATHHRQSKIDLGVIKKDGDYRITGYIEKPVYDFMVSMGIYVFEPAVMPYIKRNEYLDFPDLIKILIAAGEKVVAYEFDGYWEDLGRPDDYARASKDFENMRAQFLPSTCGG